MILFMSISPNWIAAAAAITPVAFDLAQQATSAASATFGELLHSGESNSAETDTRSEASNNTVAEPATWQSKLGEWVAELKQIFQSNDGSASSVEISVDASGFVGVESDDPQLAGDLEEWLQNNPRARQRLGQIQQLRSQSLQLPHLVVQDNEPMIAKLTI
jgi:hypothetical protein